MAARLEIRLTFHRDGSAGWPHGYWVASADADGSPEYDGSGATPLDAVMQLAEQMHKAMHNQS